MWFKIPGSNNHFRTWLSGNNTSITALTAQFKSHHSNLGQLDIFLMGLSSLCNTMSDSMWRSCFFDFSSAFNTISPTVLGEKLRAMQVDTSRNLECKLLTITLQSEHNMSVFNADTCV